MGLLKCEHTTWQAKAIPLSDGRPALREFCTVCGASNGVTRLGLALPIVSDADLMVPSRKYPNKTLGEIAKIDKGYIRWLVLESKASDRIKKSAARLYYNEPYIAPHDGEVYPKEKTYDPIRGAILVNMMKEEK